MIVALLAAAGSGKRLGSGLPKALVPLAGRPMVGWSLAALSGLRAVELIVVAAPARYEDELTAVGRQWCGSAALRVVTGGETRSRSVKRGLEAAGEASVVVVHDAARPLAMPDLVDRCLAELARSGCDGVIAAVRATDTVKEADSGQRVLRTLDRERLWCVQTPQAFRADALRAALREGTLDSAYDDAQLVEASGGEIRIVEADGENLKVTTPSDLRIAEFLLAERA